MAEKDSLEDLKQAALEEVENQVEDQVPETESEEESDFLSQWKERHQAYLESQKELGAEKEDQSTAPSRPSKPTKVEKRAQKTDSELPDSSLESDSKQSPAPPAFPRKALLKASPVIVAALLGSLLAIYFISPLSKEKRIEVVGNQRLDTATVLTYSNISEKDYALTTLLQAKTIEANIKNSSNIVKADKISFQFPNRFTIQVEEFAEVGYLKEKDSYRLVLSSGNISETAVASEALPERYTLINIADKDLVKELALQLATIDTGTLSNIESIELTPSKVTADLVTMTMHDGHTLLLPLSEIDTKLPYYPKIAKQLLVPSIVDMEVGAFSYAK